MNPYQSAPRLGFRALLAVILGLATGFPANGADDGVNQTVWRMAYKVTDAQINDANWHTADADGDGMKNGMEIAAGTNPFEAGSVVKITSISSTPTEVELTFPTIVGKQYVVQKATSLSPGSFTTLTPSVETDGTGNPATLSAPRGSNTTFFRVLVQDLDSDGDNMSDWAERQAGFDPNDATTGATNDGTALPDALAESNIVIVTVTKPSAVQPANATTPPVETGSITIARAGPLKFNAITVPLQKLGTALEGTDYDSLPASINLGPGQSQYVLTINPKFHSVRRTNVTAIVRAMPGGGYILGGAASGSVVINPGGIANGTGLTGRYQNQGSSSYSSGTPPFQTTIFAGAVEMTRTDATINFSNGVNGWGTTAGPTGMSPVSTNGSFSIRWTGQILPQYSETYFIDFRSDDGCKVWVDGRLLIDRWFSQSAADYVNSIDLKGGVPYDITIEYFNGSGNAEARLYWWSASQPKQIVPQTRLFPDDVVADRFAAITSALSAVGYVDEPFTFGVTSTVTGANTTYELAAGSGPLPPGLTLTPSTGVISGTPTTAGAYNVAVNAINGSANAVRGSSIIDFTIFPSGGVTRELLTATGNTIGDIVIPIGDPGHTVISTIDDDSDAGAYTAKRLRGYIVPPKTGNYYFWLAANNAAELWISNDHNYVNKIRRAYVTAGTGQKTWNPPVAGQQSPWLALTAGYKYYFEVLHNTGADADDYVAVGWCQDDIGTVPSVTGAANPSGATTVIPNGGGPLQGYPYSGTVPSYIFQPYDYPAVTPPDGALYAGNMGPQGGAATKASGSANLRVNAAGTQGILHFNYQNLGTPRSSYHLHVDGFVDSLNVSHQQGEIVFDLDDVDSFQPELITADGGYIWNFAPGGTFGTVAQIHEAIQKGKVYLNIHSVTYPGGEIRATLQRVEGSQTPPNPALYVEPSASDVLTDDAHVARFLNQATFGANVNDIDAVRTAGSFNQWITNQINLAPSHLSNDVVAGITADINSPYPSSLFTNAWWKYSITGPDQLRQRLAFALSEIMVVSWADDTGPLQNNGRILADYYDQLIDFCLPTPGVADSGNIRGILKAVTLTPAMGLYLDMRGNQKGDPTIGRIPNENYARELMQLFSIGLYRMWDDGRLILDANAGLVPTYTQPNIIGLASLLTGWNYSQNLQGSGRLPTNFGPGAEYLNPMMLVPLRHDLDAKLLLNNVITPAATGRTPRIAIASVGIGNPCTVTTSGMHGLNSGDTVMIAGLSGGTFPSGNPNNTSFQVTVTSATTFTIPVNCSAAPSNNIGTVTGATVLPATYLLSTYTSGNGTTPIGGSQSDNAGTTPIPHPYDQYGLKEIETAIDNIVGNDNIAPYICRLLIQRLVTSNPSPGYIYRVVQKFKNNGAGVRGDMTAVLRQILLDGEARSSSAAQANTAFGNTFGKQREPVIRLTGPARAFPAAKYTGTYTQLTGINSNKLRITTSTPNDFNPGFSFSLNFRGNYTTTTPPDPWWNPTSTTYSVGSTLGIASTYNEIISIGTSTPTIITTARPHGLVSGNTVTITGVSGTFVGTNLNSTQTITRIDDTTFSVPINTTRTFQIASITPGNPATFTTSATHGLTTGQQVTINGINGGSFSPTLSSTTLYTVTVVDDTHFTLTSGATPVNCLAPPTSITVWRHVSNPCRVRTAAPHGLSDGATITISGTSGGSFSPSISNTFSVTLVPGTDDAFTVPVNCTSPSTNNTGSIVGSNTLDVNATGMINVTYSQQAGSTEMKINTTGPQTNVTIPNPIEGGPTTLKSKVYIHPLTAASVVGISSISTGNPCTITTNQNHALSTGESVTIAGVSGGSFSPPINNTYTVTQTGATTFTVPVNCTTIPTSVSSATVTVNGITTPLPPESIYEVQANGSGNFTITTTDTPSRPRSGSVLIPKLSTSYTPLSSNTIVQFNCNVNHNMRFLEHVWVDVPVVGTPVADGEYEIKSTMVGSTPFDEDHFQTSYLPVSSGLGNYPKPSGSNNGITLWPLVAPPLGRSGNVEINQSTFSLGSTEGSLSQSPLNSPTVFNFFFPDYQFPGPLANNGLDSPEFQLSTATNMSNLTNSITNMVIGTGGGNSNVNGLSSFSNGSSAVVIDLGSHMTTSKTSDAGIPDLINDLATILVGGPLQDSTKTTIANFVTGKRSITAISQQNPCRITSPGHGLTNSTSITITGVSGGSFSSSINSTFTITYIDANTFSVPVNCTNNTTINLSGAGIPNFPLGSPPSNSQMRDRVRAIVQLILTSAEYAVQK